MILWTWYCTKKWLQQIFYKDYIQLTVIPNWIGRSQFQLPIQASWPQYSRWLQLPCPCGRPSLWIPNSVNSPQEHQPLAGFRVTMPRPFQRWPPGYKVQQEFKYEHVVTNACAGLGELRMLHPKTITCRKVHQFYTSSVYQEIQAAESWKT